MSSSKHIYAVVFISLSTSLVLTHVKSKPVSKSDSPLDIFIDFLSTNNCTMPEEVKLPFTPSSDPSPFSYLFTPLQECRTNDALQDNDEAKMLCKEVFDVLQNITCIEKKGKIPEVENNLSENVCQGFKTLKYPLPQNNDYLSGKLNDSVLCKILCTKSKYELLCKTLLWSYEIQARIKNSDVDAKSGKEDDVKNTSEKGLTPIKISLVEDKSVLSDPKLNSIEQNKSDISNSTLPENMNSIDGSHLNNSNSAPELSKTASEITTQNITNKQDTHYQKSELEKVDKSAISSKSVVPSISQNKSPSENDKLIQNVTANESKKIAESATLHNQDQQNKADLEKNEVNVDEQPTKAKAADSLDSDAYINTFKLKPETVKENQDDKNLPVDDLQSKKKNNNINGDVNVKTGEKSQESVNSPTGVNDELNNINAEENESNIKQPDLKSETGKEIEKPKLGDFGSPNETPLEDSKLPESSTLQIMPDEEAEPHQEEREPDQYNDTENEGDYPKSDYDNSFKEPVRNREPIVKSSVVAGSSQLSNNYDAFLNPRNHIGRVPDEMPMISAFPEQEDSHFFFYFLSIVLILMAGYLIFHNKQKIIALIVEGRHERRRRSHGAGYKKLETK